MTNAGSATAKRSRVLIVDDSASVRRALTEIIESDPGLEVMGTAPDPFVAAERIAREVPDVMFLDIEMPRMDGLTFLRKIMAQRPLPVVICSSLTEEGSTALIAAMDAGAVDIVTKPRMGSVEFLQHSRMRICDAARAAAQARVKTRPATKIVVEKKLTADAVLPQRRPGAAPRAGTSGERIVCLGASTGGTEAIREVLQALPADSPPIVIVQHMPEGFTAAFARRLDGLCAVRVKEAAEGDLVLPGQVLIAPGNRHMMLNAAGGRLAVRVVEGPPVSRHRPSVDVLFRSAAQQLGPRALGMLLTGMGDDGAHGLLEIRQAGGTTIAQDEESCVVFGMPKEAIERGAAMKILPLARMAQAIVQIRHAPIEPGKPA